MSNHKTSRQTVEAVTLFRNLTPEQQEGVNDLCRAVQKHVIEIYVPGNGLAVVRMPKGVIPDEATIARCKKILAKLQKEAANDAG